MTRNTTRLALSLCLLLFSTGLAMADGVNVENGLTREFSVRPGDKVEGQIAVKNDSSAAQTVRIYQVDYSFHADGQTDYGEPGSLARSNSKWMTVAPKQLTVPAESTASAYFAIQVPDDKTLTGTYWSVIMVEPVAEGSLEPPKPGQGKVAVGINTVMRYAVQIVTNVGTSGTMNIKIAQKQLLADDNGYALSLDIENTGERWVRPFVRVELYDASGALAGRFDGERVRIYPGCSVRSRVNLRQIEPGRYTALVLIDNGDKSVWGAQYDLEIK